MNRVCLVGNLTRDPELRALPSGSSVASLRVAVNTRRKEGDEWVDKPNFFNVSVFGRQADSVAQYLAKGRQVAIDGRLEWREWESDAGRREAVEIIADNVMFIGGKGEDGGGGEDFTPSAQSDDDIPFAPTIDGLGN